MKMLNGLQSVTVAERLWIGNGNWQEGGWWKAGESGEMPNQYECNWQT